ncbi:acyl-[acyl-carrier-protein] thioesterase [Mycolicibacterium sp. CBMA 226]|uniref:acyl-[acyl-carrier-protein] thioesterase n=1 Tax=Mycolicibacterium sp. CBMA 226 TaxID=2606611 RepID=UPI0012DCF3B4|nr:acyl-[acyl-carrier-protein] thioesterase [Mycolicibacterium sp. CBMA 226]MUL76677.1 acyl-[acyl-carrier-protein] thioesterase [Mycolicibacterium sp. CBMA 226]
MSTAETAERTGEKARDTAVSGLVKVMQPVPEGHPDVFDTSWPLRMADVDRKGRLRFDGACRHIQDVGQDQLRQMGYEEVHPAWVVRRTMVDLIRPIEGGDILRLRRWCSGTSNRWCEMRVRIDGRKGGLMESEAFWINISRETQGPSRITDDFLAGLKRTATTDRLRWKGYLKAGSRDDALRIVDFPVRVSDIDLFDHMNNSVYWSVVEDYLQTYRPELLEAPLRVTIEHDAAVALGERLEIITHEYPAGSTEKFGPELYDRSVTTLTYVVGDEVKAVTCLFPL